MSKREKKTLFCFGCLNPFCCQESLNKHQEYCKEHEAVNKELPEPGTMLKFKNYYKSEKVHFVVYVDFESSIKPLDTCEPNPEISYTEQYQKHEPSSFCYYIKCFDDNVRKPKLGSYTGKDGAQKFVEILQEDIREISYIPMKKMIFGEEESVCYNSKQVLGLL